MVSFSFLPLFFSFSFLPFIFLPLLLYSFSFSFYFLFLNKLKWDFNFLFHLKKHINIYLSFFLVSFYISPIKITKNSQKLKKSTKSCSPDSLQKCTKIQSWNKIQSQLIAKKSKKNPKRRKTSSNQQKKDEKNPIASIFCYLIQWNHIINPKLINNPHKNMSIFSLLTTMNKFRAIKLRDGLRHSSSSSSSSILQSSTLTPRNE